MKFSPFLLRVLVCILAAGITLYAHIEKQNELVELRLTLPLLNRDVKAALEENIRLQYEIERFESPVHLMELARKPEFSHLKYPQLPHVSLIPEPPPLMVNNENRPGK